MPQLERRLLFKGVDNDTVIEFIENGFYRYANNINMGVTDTGNAGILESTKGNSLVVTSNLAAVEAAWNTNFSQGTFKVIGWEEDPTNKRVLYFVKNTPPTGVTQFDRVMEYSYETNSIDVVLIYPFGFSESSLITGINIVDNNLLYWTDNWISPRKINIEKAKRYMISAGSDPLGYVNVTDEVSEAIKYPPLFPPVVTIENNTASNKNNIRGKLFQFKYNYYKDDAEESCYSPISEIVIPQGDEFIDPSVSTLPSFASVNNRIRIKVNTGGYLDIKIGIAVRQGNTGDFFLIDVLDKVELGLANFVVYDYLFDNDKLLSPLSLSKSVQLYDNVPRKAKAQEYIDGNRLVYGNILEGYDNDFPLDVTISPTYTNVSQSATFKWEATFTNSSGATLITLPTVAGTTYSPSVDYVPEEGDVFFITGLNNGSGVTEPPVTHTVTAAEVADYYSNGAFTLRTNLVAQSITPTAPTGSLTMTDPFTGLPTPAFELYALGFSVVVKVVKPIKKLGSFKSGAVHPFGLAYYDFANRSGTTRRNSAFDVYAQFLPESRPGTGDYMQRIGMDWSIRHIPPIWATHYQWVYTGNTTVAGFLQFAINSIATNAAGTGSEIVITSLADYITTYPNTILSYSWTRGDRCRFITNGSHDAYNMLLDVEVLGFDSATSTLTTQLVSSSGITIGQGTLIEIYTPELQTEEKIYYEFSQCFQIGNAGSVNRFHKGETQDQDPNNPTGVPATGLFERGDVWIRPRRMNIAVSGSPVQNADDYVEDYNVSDFYASEVWDQGRPNRVGEDNQPLNGGSEYREIRRETTINYSEVFVPETNINGLSRFYDLSFSSINPAFKSIQKFFNYNYRLEVYQELKVGAVPINMKLSVDSSNNTATFQTNIILNEIVYYDGEYGIGLNPESFAVNKGRRYFVDVNRGFVCRLSTDGITPVSQTYKLHSYVTNLFRQITNSSTTVNIYGVFNKAFSRYELCTEQIGRIPSGQTIDPVTVGFTDADSYKAWTSWFSYHPEGVCGAGQDIVSFKSGEVWTHNTNPLYCNFYGVQYNPEIWVVSNMQPEDQKIYLALSMETNEAWNMISIVNNKGQDSNLITTDFEDIENVKYAPFWKDTNTVNVTDPLINGDELRDAIMVMKFTNPSTGYVRLTAVNVKHIHSMLSP